MSKQQIYRQSGAVPYFIEYGKIYYVMITSMSGNWIFPKGLVEPHLKPWESALAEAEEEAGITGEMYPKVIATYEFKKWGGLCRIHMFLLKITDIFSTWEEQHCRERFICTFDQADRIIHHRIKKVLYKADKKIRKISPNDS